MFTLFTNVVHKQINVYQKSKYNATFIKTELSV